MKKNLFLAALAFVALASCTSDEFVGENTSPTTSTTTDGAISFNSGTPAITRADKTGSAAATDLNNNFVVFGYKTMSGDSKQTVFDNYQANYVTNSAMTSTTNSAGWEYVGFKNIAADMTTNVGVTAFSALTGTSEANKDAVDQTIKYWDYSALSYKFFAYSLGAGKTGTPKTYANATLMTNAPEETYTLSGDKDQLSTCYISELKTINPSSSSEKEVDLRFLSFLSKIRVGFFENIPGYSVKDLEFYVDGTTKSTGDVSADGLAATLYEATGSGTMPNGGTYTITFDTSGKPILTFSSTGASYVASQSFGKLNGYAEAEYKEAVGNYLGRTSNAATYAYVSYTSASVNEPYTKVLPNAVGTDLTLKVDYTLVSRDGTAETINVVGATAKVPAAFTQWKPNYAYTYLFKISDNTNGSTGQDITGLYPITLDAVVASEQDGSQETITTVSEPSITTFGVNSSTGKYVSGGNEYAAGSDIYATFVDAGSVITPTLGTNVNVYLATTTNATAYPITEASVAEALLEVSAIDKKIILVNINDDDGTYFGADPTTSVDGVPSEDGKYLSSAENVAASTVNNAAGYYTDMGCTVPASLTEGYLAAGTYYKKWTNALKLTGAKATTELTALVVEYVKTAATYNTEIVTIADQSALEAYTGKLYTNTDGTTEASSTYDSGITYYKRTSVKTKGTYAYKVIRVN